MARALFTRHALILWRFLAASLSDSNPLVGPQPRQGGAHHPEPAQGERSQRRIAARRHRRLQGPSPAQPSPFVNAAEFLISSMQISPNIQNTLTLTKCRPAQLTEPGHVYSPQVFDKDSRVGAVVITGNDKFFCGGADIKVCGRGEHCRAPLHGGMSGRRPSASLLLSAHCPFFLSVLLLACHFFVLR